AADGSITIGGTAAAPTVAVAANGITNANIADGGISPAKITGTAATLGSNSFTGDQSITGGVTATSFSGDGSALTNLDASNLSSGIVPQDRLSGSYNIDISGNAATATTATTATTANNALALGGNSAASFNTTAQNDARYLQLAGGTLVGALNGTTASFSGDIQTSGTVSVPIPNEGTTGTVLNQLVELMGNPSQAINASV
ncbi:MAG: hypothetical protein DMG67_05330, partial [Acidobacteria bacterium]